MDEKIKKYEPLWGCWYVTDVLGRGGYATVYRIERREMGSVYEAAIKMMSIPKNYDDIYTLKTQGMDEESVTKYYEQFALKIRHEIDVMSKLKGNNNIVSYEDHQFHKVENGIGWDILIRMELLTSLNQYIRSHETTRRDVIRMGIGICHALELCQKYNIIHRDIKPDNIFISKDGHYKLGDFGIAREVQETLSGMTRAGTYKYMAPEIAKNERYGSTVDIYSLGIVMYCLLNQNRLPFFPPPPFSIQFDDEEKAQERRLNGDKMPMPINATGRLAEIVLKACSYHAKDRYSSPLFMRQELEAILYSESEVPIIYPQGDKIDIPVSKSSANSGELKTEPFIQTTGISATELMPPYVAIGHEISSKRNALWYIKSKYAKIATAVIIAVVFLAAMVFLLWSKDNDIDLNTNLSQNDIQQLNMIMGISKNITIKEGESYQLTPYVISNGLEEMKPFTYASLDECVVVTKDGLVKGIKGGIGEIHISLGDIKLTATVIVEELEEKKTEEKKGEAVEVSEPKQDAHVAEPEAEYKSQAAPKTTTVQSAPKALPTPKKTQPPKESVAPKPKKSPEPATVKTEPVVDTSNSGGAVSPPANTEAPEIYVDFD